MIESRFFTAEELACPTSGEVKLAEGFLEVLDDLRRRYNFPMVVTSCCRSREHNKNLIDQGFQAHPTSLHMIDNPKWKIDTCAIDIKRPDSAKLWHLVNLATTFGWSVGIATTFIHLDRRYQYTRLPNKVYTY